MLADIEKFIYDDHVYSKCNASDKEMIDTCLHGVRQQIETFKEAYKQAQEEITLLKRENKALADDNELKCELSEELSFFKTLLIVFKNLYNAFSSFVTFRFVLFPFIII